MRVLTLHELKQWCVDCGVDLDNRGNPIHPKDGFNTVRFQLPEKVSRLTWFCRFIENSLQPREHCLLWVTGWAVWPSSENWHLYYRLRQSYEDYRLLNEAPGHLFLQYEGADLISFLQVGLLAGWDMHLIPTAGYVRAFVSHDEWVELALEDAAGMDKIKADLVKVGIRPITRNDRAA